MFGRGFLRMKSTPLLKKSARAVEKSICRCDPPRKRSQADATAQVYTHGLDFISPFCITLFMSLLLSMLYRPGSGKLARLNLLPWVPFCIDMVENTSNMILLMNFPGAMMLRLCRFC